RRASEVGKWLDQERRDRPGRQLLQVGGGRRADRPARLPAPADEVRYQATPANVRAGVREPACGRNGPSRPSAAGAQESVRPLASKVPLLLETNRMPHLRAQGNALARYRLGRRRRTALAAQDGQDGL